LGYVYWIGGVSITPLAASAKIQDNLPRHSEILILKDTTLIKTIAEAMNKGKRLAGDLDWGPEFDMKLIYGDGYTEEYYIALGKKLGYKGTFTKASTSSQGYEIPVKNSDQLRKLFYGIEDPNNPEHTDTSENSVTVTGPVTISGFYDRTVWI
jgi:hypothetical protein